MCFPSAELTDETANNVRLMQRAVGARPLRQSEADGVSRCAERRQPFINGHRPKPALGWVAREHKFERREEGVSPNPYMLKLGFAGALAGARVGRAGVWGGTPL